MSCIAILVATREDYVKASVICKELRKTFETKIINIGQYLDKNASRNLCNQLGMPEPDVTFSLVSTTQLGILESRLYGDSSIELLCKKNDILQELLLVIPTNSPDYGLFAEIEFKLLDYFGNNLPCCLMVFGDSIGALSAAVVGRRRGFDIIRMDSGLRCKDLRRPDEVNRIMIDHLSYLHFVSEPNAVQNLLAEQFSKDRIHLVEDTVNKIVAVISSIYRKNPSVGDLLNKIRSHTHVDTIRIYYSVLNRMLLNGKVTHKNVINAIEERKISNIPYDRLNKGLAKMLVVNNTYFPYYSPSLNVLTKKLLLAGEIYDLVVPISVPSKDVNTVQNVARQFIGTVYSCPEKMTRWSDVMAFYKRYSSCIKRKSYEKIYSRTSIIYVRIATIMYKMEKPGVKLIVDISDPIRTGFDGKPYPKTCVGDRNFLSLINTYAKDKYGLPAVTDIDELTLCEYMIYLYADEIIFTNENQMKHMINSFPIIEIQSIVRGRLVVSPQPTLPLKYYSLINRDYEVKKDKINIGYFGSLLNNRWLESFFRVFVGMNIDIRNKFIIHIFSNKKGMRIIKRNLEQLIVDKQVYEHIAINRNTTLIPFLNMCTKMDILLLDDCKCGEAYSINPYLPSKLSDYIGSGKPIWCLYEQGSILSRKIFDIMTPLDDHSSILEQFILLSDGKNTTK